MDIDYLLALQEFRDATGGALDSFMNGVSQADVVLCGLILQSLILWCVNREAGMFLLLANGIGGCLNTLVKNIACVYRPWIRSSALHPVAEAVPDATGYSFRSGHTQTATTALGGIATVWRKKRWLVVLCVVGILLVGFSRNYLGVHTPQDVLFGIIVGIAGIAIAWWVYRFGEHGGKHDIIVLVVGLVLCAVFVIFCLLKPYPYDYVDNQLLVDPEEMVKGCFVAAGLLAGSLIAWFCERRWVQFSVEGSTGTRIVRAIIGLVILAVIMYGAKAPLVALLGVDAGSFARYMLLALTAGLFYPMAFSAVQRRRASKNGSLNSCEEESPSLVKPKDAGNDDVAK